MEKDIEDENKERNIEEQKSLRKRLERFLTSPQQLRVIYDAFPDELPSTIRGRLNENIGKVFQRVGRGIYITAYGEGQALVLEGDAWQRMKEFDDDSFDAIITDPPYPALDGQMSVGTSRQRNLNRGWDFETKALDDDILREFHRVLKPGGHLWVFAPANATTNLSDTASYNESQRLLAKEAGFTYNKTFVWDKVSIGMGYVGRARHELIYHFSKGKLNNLGGFSRKPNPQHYVHDVLTAKVPRGTNRLHQTEKPIELLTDILQFSTLEGDLVLDPFAGSLSLAHAAIATGRNAVCIEFSQENITKGMQRFEGE